MDLSVVEVCSPEVRSEGLGKEGATTYVFF